MSILKTPFMARTLSLAGFAALSLSASLPAQANEAAGAAQLDKLLPVCQACHGEHGAKPILPEYPVLAGQHANYVEHALKDYRAGTRKNAVMKAQAANLSDADIKALSQYFAHQASPIYTFKLPPTAK